MQEQVNLIPNIIQGILLFAIIAGAAYYQYIRKNGHRRKKPKKEDKKANNNQEINFSDIREILPIEDIANDMIVEKGGKRYHAVLTCRGFDFLQQPLEEQLMIQDNYIAFLFARNEPFCYRQDSEATDMSYTIGRYENAKSEREAELFQVTEDYRELLERYHKHGQYLESVENDLENLKRHIDALSWRIRHIEHQISYIQKISGANSEVQKSVQLYVVTWDSTIGVTGNRKNKTIGQQAAEELDKKVRVMIQQLGDAGVIAKRCVTNELIDICRRHMLPVTGKTMDMEKISNSVWNDIISTDSFDEKKEAFERQVVSELQL